MGSNFGFFSVIVIKYFEIWCCYFIDWSCSCYLLLITFYFFVTLWLGKSFLWISRTFLLQVTQKWSPSGTNFLCSLPILLISAILSRSIFLEFARIWFLVLLVNFCLEYHLNLCFYTFVVASSWFCYLIDWKGWCYLSVD